MGRLADSLSALENYMFTEEFFAMVESYVTFFRENSGTTIVSVDPLVAARYKGDFFGLLNEAGLDKKYHYLVMRMNNYYASSDFDGTDTELLMPPKGEVDRVFNNFNTIES